MVFRLPTPLESWIPPPNEQLPQSRPWRGTVSIHGMNIFQRPDGQQVLNVMAAETQGDNRAELWPHHLSFFLTRNACRLNDAQEWVRANKPELCMFMPDRLHDANERARNEANFRSVARTMLEHQIVAIAPWNAPNRLPGAGILVLPIPSSTGLMVGVIFLADRFPEFLVPSPILSAIQNSSVGQGLMPLYQQQQPYHHPSSPGSSSTSTGMYYGNNANAAARAQQRPASRMGYYPQQQQQQFQSGMSSFLNQGQSYSYPIIAGPSVYTVPHRVPSNNSNSNLDSDASPITHHLDPDPLSSRSQLNTNWPVVIRIGDEEGEVESGSVVEREAASSTSTSLPAPAHEDDGS